ncbi:putative cupin superfamily protein [Pseudomonas sp. SORGH_AS 211]|uniref:cupin domain-containing protein n=1 Tax=Pseudomonas sp. SORGH_AS_0211 TaxID=3041796 RepID=UPI002858DD3E|nr:cupin domain-containing protein [Pseudomonas sp. SORGH_AS_0211]MDR6179024.1 putative cupin superfamily protein [Pseudomonas sp. SORGH_AS_0211]
MQSRKDLDKIVHWTQLQAPDGPGYPDSDERFSLGAAFGRHFGFARLGIHHEWLPPGRRTSRPHAEATEDEFIYVIAGHPTAWIDGHAHRLKPGDGVGFKAGDGVAHTFINETDEPVELLVVGDAGRTGNRLHYPLHPEYTAGLGDRQWRDCPRRELGPHSGEARKFDE